MTVVLLVVIVAVVVGWLRGGSMHTLAELEMPLWGLVILAVFVQLLGAFAGALGLARAHRFYVGGMVTSAVLVSVFVARNRRLPGMTLIAAGFICNAIVVTANGAMPVSVWAMARAGLSTESLYRGTDAKHELLDDDTRLPQLADIVPVPVPLPVGSNVVSVGDVLLAAGIGVLVVNGMRHSGGHRSAENESARAHPSWTARV